MTLCTQITIEDLTPTLEIVALDAIMIPRDDVPTQNRYGVGLGMRVQGSGSGNLKINWGTDYTETKTGIIAGYYEFKETLPLGTHNICCDLFNVVPR